MAMGSLATAVHRANSCPRPRVDQAVPGL